MEDLFSKGIRKNQKVIPQIKTIEKQEEQNFCNIFTPIMVWTSNTKKKSNNHQNILQIVQKHKRKSEQLKKVELYHQNNFYEKLYRNLQQQLKRNKNHSTPYAQQQIQLKQKCRNYKHLKRSKKVNTSRFDVLSRKTERQPQKKLRNTVSSRMIERVGYLMNECQKENKDINGTWKNLLTFQYYCNKLDNRLENVGSILSKNYFEQ